MRIFAIQNYNSASFGNNPEAHNLVQKYVSEEMKKQDTFEKISAKVYNNFENDILNKIKNAEKFSNPYNKAKMLNHFAQSAYKADDIERAGVILGAFFEVINQDFGLFENKKDELLNKQENFDLLGDYFYTSNNLKGKFFVMQNINQLGKKEFLPIAESVCGCDDDVVAPNDKRTIYEARQLINKHYDLNVLKPFIKEDNAHKYAVLKIISKWGLENSLDLANALENDISIEIVSLAKNVQNKLCNLQDDYETEFETEPPRKIKPFKDSIPNYKLRELIKNNSYDNELIKMLGNIGSGNQDLEFIKSIPADNEKIERIKTEAYLKILLRKEMKA